MQTKFKILDCGFRVVWRKRGEVEIRRSIFYATKEDAERCADRIFFSDDKLIKIEYQESP
jgi:hypothetical protein